MSLYIRRFTPNGTIKHTKYFCLMAEDDNVTFTIPIGSAVTTSDLKYVEYSTDQGNTWTKINNSASTTVTITTPAINHGNTVLLRGQGIRTNHGSATNVNNITNIRGSGKFNTRGCIMTLLSGITADETTELDTGTTYTFGLLYSGSTNLTSTNDYFLGSTFKSCINLESITNPPSATAVTFFRPYEFYDCRKLDFNWLDTTYITKLGDRCFFNCTNLPNELIFPSITTLASGTTSSHQGAPFWGIGRRKIYLPNCQTIESSSFSGNSKALELIDLGNVTGSYFYPGRGNTTAQTVTVIMRSTAVPTFSTFTATNIRRLYVYQDILTDFVTQYTAAASITYAIGGTEWQEDFGSSDEWADYPNGQAPVIPT